MRDAWIWTIQLGRWFHVHLRVHMLFVLFAVFLQYACSSSNGGTDWFAASCFMSLAIASLMHEFGHIYVAKRLGGIADEVVIGPLGGLSPVRVPYEPQSEIVAMMAGTLVNSLACLISAIFLASLGVDLIRLLDPLRIEALIDGSRGLVLLKAFFWINWIMILVNLIPAFPFDAGRCLRASLIFFWPELDVHQTIITVSRLGRLVAAILAVVAFLNASVLFSAAAGSPVVAPTFIPVWFALILLAIYIFFCSQHEEQLAADSESVEENVFGYDFSQGYTSLERSLSESSPTDQAPRSTILDIVNRWLEKRRMQRELRRVQQDADDDLRMDEVLGRLHQTGMHSLSREDRELLHRVSKRYRSRQD